MYDDDLSLAQKLADAADQVTMASFGSSNLAVSEKPDHTPVSEADQATERAIRDLIRKNRPSDAIVGEEYGTSEAGKTVVVPVETTNPARIIEPVVEPVETKGSISTRRWIIDPIDGTKNYVRGVPVWATLIALADGDEVVVGVVSAPALGRRWWAAKGSGAWVSVFNGEPRRLHVSQISDLSQASISYASLGGWGQQLPRFLELLATAYRTRAYGDFWSYMLVAEGAVDIAAEPELELYDMAALVPIVTEAGGKFTSLTGTPGPWGGNAIATNSLLHDAASQYLNH